MTNQKFYAPVALLSLLLLTFSFSAQAEQEPEADPIWDAVTEAAVMGPAQVELRNEAVLDVEESHAFIPRPAADGLMQSMGNTVDDQFIGLIMPTSETDYWFITVDYVESGYIEDGEAKDWDVEALYETLEEGTEYGNEFRMEQGIQPIEITGWVEKPRYTANNHQLVWSVGLREIGADPSIEQTINYNTYLLGREGYLALTLVTDMSLVEAQKPMMASVLGATSYVAGRTYQDFNSDTDDVAAYGLAALVGGVAAKKMGLLAVLAAFVLKGGKLLALALVPIGLALKRIFGKK